MRRDKSMARAVRVLYSELRSQGRRGEMDGWVFGAATFGLRSGRFVWVDPLGTVTKVQHWEDGWPNGVEAHWWGVGRMKSCGILVDGMRHGAWTEWHWNGKRSERRNYKLDLENGVSEAWREDGTLRLRVNFKLGREDGLSESWHPNGELQSVSSLQERSPAERRSLRGGSFAGRPASARSAFSGWLMKRDAGGHIGFRPALELR